MNTGEPGPGHGGVVLQRDRLTEHAQRLRILSEVGVREPRVDVSEDVPGLDPHGALKRRERFTRAPGGQQGGGQVVERIGIVRIPFEVELEILDGAGIVSEERVRMAQVLKRPWLAGSELQHAVEFSLRQS